MNTTVAQNQAHRSDAAWIKGSSSLASYTSEYRNAFTGQTIRKFCGMTGQDWHIFNEAGELVGRAHSLTWAKMDAAA